MSGRIEVRLAGFGGQGIARAGFVLGKAIALADGKEAVFTQEYGPESRGGASSASVVASTTAIDEPFVTRPDVFVAMYQAAFDKYATALTPTAHVLIDEDLVEAHDLPEGVTVEAVPCTRIADELGKTIVANVVMLGFLAAVTTGLVSTEGLRATIETSVPAKLAKLNLEAFQRGYDHGRALRERGEHSV